MGLSGRSRHLALDLLSQFHSHISAEILSRSTDQYPSTCGRPFSALRCIGYYGIAELANDFITTREWDVNQSDRGGLTLLMWVARYGREELVEFLLEQEDTWLDIADKWDGRTALSWAAGSGYQGVVRLFLDPLFVNPGSSGSWWRTEQVMSLLFGRRYVDPNRADNDGRTPLSWAAGNGHAGAVKVLLEQKDVSLDTPDNHGQTPLWWATLNGHTRVVKLLLVREDVNHARLDNYGRTPLALARLYRNLGVLELLRARNSSAPRGTWARRGTFARHGTLARHGPSDLRATSLET